MTERTLFIVPIAVALACVVAQADDFSTVCREPEPIKTGQTDKGDDPNYVTDTTKPVPEMKKQYCNAAEMARSGASKNKSLAGVYGLAAATCTVVCISQKWMHPIPPTVCYAPAGYAVADELMKTKSLGGLFGSLTGGAGGSGMMVGMAGVYAANKMGKGVNKSPCYAAAFSAMQMMAKNEASKQDNAVYKTNLESARAMLDAQPTENHVEEGGQVDSAGGNIDISAVPDACERVALGDSTSMIQCASSSKKDPLAGDLATGTNLVAAFEKTTGKSASDFLKNGDFSSSGLSDATSGKLSSAESSAIAKQLAAVEADVSKGALESPTSDVYAGGRGGGQSQGGGEMDFSDFMGKMMGGMAPDGSGRAPASNPNADIEFALKYYGPNAVANNREIGLFRRASFAHAQWCRKTECAPVGAATTAPRQGAAPSH